MVKAKTQYKSRKTYNSVCSLTSRRLEALPAEIERLEAEIAKLTELLSDPELFAREPVKFRKATEALTTRQKALSDAEEEWLQLEEKASG